MLAMAACVWLGGEPMPAQQQAPPQPDEPTTVLIKLVERRFDVAGLAVPRDFPAVDLRRSRRTLDGPSRAAPADERRPDLSDALRAKSGIVWFPGCAVEVIQDGRILRVVHTPETLKKIADWLDVLRGRLSRRISISATVLAADAPRHHRPPKRMRALTEAEARKLIDGAATAEHLERLTEFRLTLVDGQLGNLLDANQVSYLGMPKVTATPYAKAFDPQVHVVLEGLSVEARASWNAAVDQTLENSSVWIDFKLQAATLIRPIQQIKSPVGTIQFPIVVHQQARGEIRLPERGWAVLSGLREVDAAGKPQRHLLFVLHVEVNHLHRPLPESKR
jgi:hypothetical protein